MRRRITLFCLRFPAILLGSLFCLGASQALAVVAPFSVSKTVSPSSGLLVGDIVNVCLDVSSPPPQADILWVIDVSNSMQVGITTTVANLVSFTAQLSSSGIDYRNHLFIYTGFMPGQLAPPFNNGGWFYVDFGWATDDTDFANDLNNSVGYVGGGIEWTLDALLFAKDFVTWRTYATKTMVLITDEAIYCTDNGNNYPVGGGGGPPVPATESLASTAAALNIDDITLFSISKPWPGATDPEGRCDTQSLPAMTGGLWQDYSSPPAAWSSMLSNIASLIVGNSNLLVRDPLPPQLAPVPGTLNGGTQVGNEVQWTVSAAAQGSVMQFCFDAEVVAPWPGAVTNTGKASADGVPEQNSNPVPLFFATPTITMTSSNTQTSTQTNTTTPTFTETITSTSTPTPSFTRTPTPSFTATPTYTNTRTPSFTHTPTHSNTQTPTSTGTQSWTYTGTPTFTHTPTATPTVTASWTFTHTPTFTASATSTHTATQTWSFTATPTRTQTATATPSYTQTPTSTASPSFTATASPSSTRTASPTATETPTHTSTATASATRTVTPSRTQTPTHSASATQTQTQTATPTYTETPSQTSTRTITETNTVTPTYSASPTASPTRIPMPFRLILGVYNSAGEKVKQLYDGGVSAWPGNSTLDPAVLGDWGSVIRLRLSGKLPDTSNSLSWDGTNDQNQPVNNGAYWFKMEIHNSDDVVTAISLGVVVLRPERGLSLGVFNAAGERVADLALPFDADPNSLSLVELAGGEARLNYTSPAGPGQVTWTGLNRDGLAVANGSYIIRSLGQGSSKTLAFTLLRGPVDGGHLRVAPNPAGSAVAKLRLNFGSPAGSREAHARLYNLAGELMRENVAPAMGGVLWLDVAQLAGGIYVVVLNVDGVKTYRQIQKVALIR